MEYMPHFGGMTGFGPGFLAWSIPLLVLVTLWSAFWKGLALWHSAKRGEKWWFIILLVVNTLGILEIVYLFVWAKMRLGTLFVSSNATKSE